MTMLTLLAESAIRSLALAAAVGLGLKIARVKNAQAQITAWSLVLLTAVLMPVLMQWRTVTVPAPVIPLPSMLPPMASLHPVPRASIDWQGILGSFYLSGTILLLLRLLTGLALTSRLRRAASPVPAEWDVREDVRQSDAIAAPVTFGSTILLPAECIGWTPAMRQAVLAHERSHVENGDFYIQFLASVYRAGFWFSPLAWWLPKKLAELAETRSDDAAIANFPDRPSYAEILLGFAKKVQRMPLAVGMARPATVVRRVDRILTGTPEASVLNSRTKVLLIASLFPLVVLAAGCSVHARAQSPVQTSARPAAPPAPAAVHASPAAPHVPQEQKARLSQEEAELAQLQEVLEQKQAQAAIQPPDVSRELDSISAQLQILGERLGKAGEFRQEDLSEMQARMSDIQARSGDMQNRMSDAQAALAQQQAELVQKQAKLAEQQARFAQEAAEQIRIRVEELLHKHEEALHNRF